MGNDVKKEVDPNDPRFRPQGLYPAASLKWEKRFLSKLIIDKKLAAYQKGVDDLDPASPDLEECPICFLYYNGGLNRALCCGKGICTECYVYIRAPPPALSICPFCQTNGFTAEYSGPLTAEARAIEKAEETKVKEIELRMRLEEIEEDRKREEEKKRRSSAASTPTTSTPLSQTPAKPGPGTPTLNRGPSTPVGIPIRAVPQPTSTPANSVVSPPTLSGGDMPFKVASEADILDLEEKMLQEAIRLSLQTHSNTATPKK